MQVSPGTIIDDRFEIISQIGVGGMGSIFLAHQRSLGRSIAVKFLEFRKTTEFPELALRFEREAKVLTQLNHKNIVSVYGYGVSNNVPYIMLEHVEGTSLERTLATGALPLESCIRLFGEICSGVSYAHERNVLHRDLKPSNIMITASGSVKVIDFGLAKLVDSEGPGQDLTQAGHAVGTSLYMSPEQCSGAPLDTRADIYALGCIFFECLTGTVPFDGGTDLAIRMAHCHSPIPSLNDSVTGAAEGFADELDAIIHRCLEKDSCQRFSSVAELAAALNELDLPGPEPAVSKGSGSGRNSVRLPRSRSKSRFVTKKALFFTSIGAVSSLLIAGVLLKPLSSKSQLPEQSNHPEQAEVRPDPSRATKFMERFNALREETQHHAGDNGSYCAKLLELTRPYSDAHPAEHALALLNNYRVDSSLSVSSREELLAEAQRVLRRRASAIFDDGCIPTVNDLHAFETLGLFLFNRLDESGNYEPFCAAALKLPTSLHQSESSRLQLLAAIAFSKYSHGARSDGLRSLRAVGTKAGENPALLDLSLPILTAVTAGSGKNDRQELQRINAKSLSARKATTAADTHLAKTFAMWFARFAHVDLQHEEYSRVDELFATAVGLKREDLRNSSLSAIIFEARKNADVRHNNEYACKLARRLLDLVPDVNDREPYFLLYTQAFIDGNKEAALGYLDKTIAIDEQNGIDATILNSEKALRLDINAQVLLAKRDYHGALAGWRKRLEIALRDHERDEVVANMRQRIATMEVLCKAGDR